MKSNTKTNGLTPSPKAAINRIAYVELVVLALLIAFPFLAGPSGEAAYGAAIVFILFLAVGTAVCFLTSLIIVLMTKGQARLHVLPLGLSLILGGWLMVSYASRGTNRPIKVNHPVAHQTPAGQKAIAWVSASGGSTSSDGMSAQWSHKKVRDISPLADLSELTSVSLNHTDVSDLTPLAGLTKLKALYLEGTMVTDLTPLANLTSLVRLSLMKTEVTDFSPLTTLVNLEQLYLTDTSANREAARVLEDLPKCVINWISP